MKTTQHHSRDHSRDHSRGMTLIESLVGMAVLCLGLAGAVKMQAWLHQTSELARQRTDAIHLAQQELEQLRQFTDRAGFQAITNREADATAGATRFRLSRQIVGNLPHRKDGVVDVAWTGLSNTVQTVRLESHIAGVAPIYSAALGVPAQDRTLAPRRHLPPNASPWHDDRSSVPASPGSRISWIVDNASGWVVSQCSTAASAASSGPQPADRADLAHLADCTPTTGMLVRGYIRYSLGAQPDANTPNDVPLALHVTAPSAHCEMERPAIMRTDQRHLAYICLVPLNDFTPEQLSLVPEGWNFGREAGHYRACRYVSTDGSATALHNFLVVRGDVVCPGTVASPLTPHNAASVNTVPHPS